MVGFALHSGCGLLGFKGDRVVGDSSGEVCKQRDKTRNLGRA